MKTIKIPETVAMMADINFDDIEVHKGRKSYKTYARETKLSLKKIKKALDDVYDVFVEELDNGETEKDIKKNINDAMAKAMTLMERTYNSVLNFNAKWTSKPKKRKLF